MAIFDTKPTVDKPLASAGTTKKPVVITTHSKLNVQNRLNMALNSREARNRSSDLVPLTQDYEALRKNFNKLIEAAKVYHDSLGRTDAARMESVETMSKILRNTPFESVAVSDVNVHHQLSNKHREMSKRYKTEIIDYIVDLDKTISTRVDTEQKQVHELHQRLTHYEKKVEKLRGKVRAKLSKKAEVPKSKSDKLQRNEDKLKRAWTLHEAKSSRICDLLEEVTVNGWKDLYSVVGHMFEFEKISTEEDLKITNELTSLKTQLEGVFNEHDNSMTAGGATRGTPVALETAEAKKLVHDTEAYNDNISLSSSSSSSAWSNDANAATSDKKSGGAVHMK